MKYVACSRIILNASIYRHNALVVISLPSDSAMYDRSLPLGPLQALHQVFDLHDLGQRDHAFLDPSENPLHGKHNTLTLYIATTAPVLIFWPDSDGKAGSVP